MMIAAKISPAIERNDNLIGPIGKREKDPLITTTSAISGAS